MILRDTGALFASLQPGLGASGSLQTLDKPMGIEFMLGGSPLSTLAGYHQVGDPARNRPPREIMVVPPESEQKKMGNAAAKIITKYLSE